MTCSIRTTQSNRNIPTRDIFFTTDVNLISWRFGHVCLSGTGCVTIAVRHVWIVAQWTEGTFYIVALFPFCVGLLCITDCAAHRCGLWGIWCGLVLKFTIFHCSLSMVRSFSSTCFLHSIWHLNLLCYVLVSCSCSIHTVRCSLRWTNGALLFFPSPWLNVKVVHVVVFLEKLYLSECHRPHSERAAWQSNACSFLFNNHSKLEIS